MTQQNVHIFIHLKVAKVTLLVAKNNHISWKEAFLGFYNSRIYDVLEKEESKLWYEGVNYIYIGIEMEKKGEKFDI